MTVLQKERIITLRNKNESYAKIAVALGLSVNTVKSFCRRNNIKNRNDSNDEIEENKELCKNCGKKLTQTSKIKAKIFCCDKCRFDWWNANRGKMNRKGVHRLTCAHCGEGFSSYDKNRKYCGHACYISDRFGKETYHDERTI